MKCRTHTPFIRQSRQLHAFRIAERIFSVGSAVEACEEGDDVLQHRGWVISHPGGVDRHWCCVPDGSVGDALAAVLMGCRFCGNSAGCAAADEGEPVIDVVGGEGVVWLAVVGPEIQPGASGAVVDRQRRCRYLGESHCAFGSQRVVDRHHAVAFLDTDQNHLKAFRIRDSAQDHQVTVPSASPAVGVFIRVRRS